MKKHLWATMAIVLMILTGCHGSSETGVGQDAVEQQSSSSLSGNAETGSLQMASDFALADLAGNEITLRSLRGKPVFLNFWATWCGPCVAEMPGIQQLHTEQGANVHIVCVNLMEPRSTVNAYLNGKGYGWTFLFDTNGDIARSYEISAIPTTVVIDPEGRVRSRHVGSMHVAAMRSMLATAQ